MSIDFLLKVFEEQPESEAIVWHDRVYTYGWLLEQVQNWRATIKDKGIPVGAVTVLEADFSPNAIALFLALLDHQCILVPLTRSVETQKPEFIEIAAGEFSFCLNERDEAEIYPLPYRAQPIFYETLRQRQHPGLVLFSSGSTGKSKAAVHDMSCILEKFKVRRHKQRTLTFLLYDHIGGVNTMLHTLSNGGCLITLQDRSPDTALRVIEKYGVELLPTSPTFINLILLSEAYKRYAVSSLKTITYGTEPMPESTLKRFHELFPDIKLQQTYGLSEVGILRSKSKDSDSLWVKIGGAGFETRVVDDILQIKAQSAMLGYLNAPSPFTDDGWFNTGDAVEVEGEYFRILGRKSEMINVGGHKVYPAEVESALLQLSNVRDVTVRGEPNPITGQAVSARFNLDEVEDLNAFRKRVREFCRSRLSAYAIPVRIEVVSQDQFSQRFKKMRRETPNL